MIRRNCCSACEHAGGGPALAHVTVAPALDVALVWRTISIMLSHGFVEESVFGELPSIPRRVSGQRVAHALAQRAGGVGPGALEL